MSEELGFQSPQVSRRRLLQTASGTAVIGCPNAKAVTPVAADPGTQQWAFDTGDGVYSSPTVVDGTVFVGSDDENLYAVDAETGTQQWTFETGDWVRSSPTVVDETVFVGSDDGNLYAVDAGVEGSSEGSRTMLGTLGHHNEWSHSEQTEETEADSDTGETEADTDTEGTTDDESPGFGVPSAIAGLGGVGYLLKRRLGESGPDDT